MPARIHGVNSQPSIAPVCDGWFVTSAQKRIELKESKKFHDEHGNVMFRLNNITLTLSGKIALADAKGAEIGYVRRRQRTICPFASGGFHTTYCFGYKHNGKTGVVKTKGTNPCPSGCNADIFLGDTWIGETEGSWFTKSFTIYMEGIEVAKVLRTAESVEGGFSIITAAGVDSSLILMIVLALGEIYQWADSYNGGVSSNIFSHSASYTDSTRNDPTRNRNKVYSGVLG